MKSAALACSIIANIALLAVIALHDHDQMEVHDPTFIQVTDKNGNVRLSKYGDTYNMVDKSGRISATARDNMGGIGVSASDSSDDNANIQYVWMDSDYDGIFENVLDLTGQTPVTKIVNIDQAVELDD